MSLLTSSELAAHLRVSDRTIARMASVGCPSVLVRSRRRYHLPDVMRWMGEQACRQGETKTDAGTQKFASAEDAYIANSRQAQRRRKPKSLRSSLPEAAPSPELRLAFAAILA